MTVNEITYEIRGAIYDVYKELGPGLLESVYEEALAFELQERGLEVARQVEVPIIYKGKKLKTALRLDLMVNNQVIVELKSVEEMNLVFGKQLRQPPFYNRKNANTNIIYRISITLDMV